MSIEHSSPKNHPERQLETVARVNEIESKMSNGIKVPYPDLDWYLKRKNEEFAEPRSMYWRHIESDTIYRIRGLGLASTGSGQLVLMVHFIPYENDGPKFERQYARFKERFEPVVSRTVWDKA